MKAGPVLERFWAKVAVSTPSACWEWTASLDAHGYGQFRLRPKTLKAHRFAYELLIGPIPGDMGLDHLCRNKRCVNPAHLEPVTQRENLLRSPICITALKVQQTHCKRGHPLSGKNLHIQHHKNRLPSRHCRECGRLSKRPTT